MSCTESGPHGGAVGVTVASSGTGGWEARVGGWPRPLHREDEISDAEGSGPRGARQVGMPSGDGREGFQAGARVDSSAW